MTEITLKNGGYIDNDQAYWEGYWAAVDKLPMCMCDYKYTDIRRFDWMCGHRLGWEIDRLLDKKFPHSRVTLAEA